MEPMCRFPEDNEKLQAFVRGLIATAKGRKGYNKVFRIHQHSRVKRSP